MLAFSVLSDVRLAQLKIDQLGNLTYYMFAVSLVFFVSQLPAFAAASTGRPTCVCQIHNTRVTAVTWTFIRQEKRP